jgi:hypothetical protein
MRSTSPDEDKKMEKTHFLSFTLIFSSAIGLCLAASWTYPQGKTITAVNPATPLEMTSLDLASVKVWNSNLVSALGFMLGMNRKDVYKIAQQQSLDLEDELGQACLNGKSCSVFSRGRDLGLTLSFNGEDVVDKVRITLFSRSVPKEDQSEWLARKFRGETYKLAADYSDNQRIRVLGLADVERPPGGGGSEYPVVSDQVEAGRGHKRGEFFDKLERLKNDVARAVPPAALKAIQNLGIAGSGFRDMIRLAGSPYSVWKSIVETNQDHVDRFLGEFIEYLERMRSALKKGNLSGEFARAVEVYERLKAGSGQ